MSSPADGPFGRQWMIDYFLEVDLMNPDGLLQWYTEDGSFRFAGQAAVSGKPAIRRVLSQFYASMRTMRHRPTGIWIDEAACSGSFEAEVDFTLLSGRLVTVPAVSVLRLRNHRVHTFSFVMDPSPLQEHSA